MKSLRILGTRGVPATHGGFETFAERLALHLVARGWKVTVYCQIDGAGQASEDNWRGVNRVLIPVGRQGPAGTVLFDWRATRHAARSGGLCLTLGYNTAVFCSVLRLKGVANVINMDGIEWQRAKWRGLARTWFWLNERAGCWLGNHLVADHPGIADHLRPIAGTAKMSVIPYGADRLQGVTTDPVVGLGLRPGRYLTLIARPEPENSVLEVVQGFSQRLRGLNLAVLGAYRPENAYHRAVLAAAGSEVMFLGAIYDRAVVDALRAHSLAYVHGHQVGGTNPSLVEALGAGNAVLAHDNRFNRWVAGDGAVYFDGAHGFAQVADQVLDDDRALAELRAAAAKRFEEAFQWPTVLEAYERLLSQWLPLDQRAPAMQ